MLFLVNVDDISGETVPYVIEGLMARGATNVHVMQALTKKGRPEYLFLVDAPEEQIEALGGFLAAELGTLGLHIVETHHVRFEYQVRHVRLTAQIDEGLIRVLVRVKEVLNREGQTVSVKAEYEDLQAALARFRQAGVSVSLAALKGLVEQTVLGQEEGFYRGIRAEFKATHYDAGGGSDEKHTHLL
ncbi:MAG: hypothetical protein DRI79_06225 [Chloroflexi bacterium]|mgnify:CR=1 FL=1|nr:MAG: hypothetical protein DRI80_00345 [Chloroflexota bacterium]RLC89709.1 MAG: hypothetical protein DRI79_06225 [Chloroflexota bacterium]HEY67666.1 LarC family nickel insertion protein [Thermoflexia bacterium]